MRDLLAELKELRLHGMATAWAELSTQDGAAISSSRWLLEHLLQQEHDDRAMRSVRHQLSMAKLPMHRDLAGFDFAASCADAGGWGAMELKTNVSRIRVRFTRQRLRINEL